MAMEEHEHGSAPRGLEVQGFTAEQIGYAYLLHDAGLIHAIDMTTKEIGRLASPSWMPWYLRWAGHEFLAPARPPGRWDNVKNFAAKAGDIAFTTILSLLASQAAKDAGLVS